MSKKDDEAILQSMRDFRKRAEDYWKDIYQQADDDIEFCVNKESQWDSSARQKREEDGRTCLVVNKMMTFVKQQVNSLRSNKMTINAIPIDDTDVAKAQIQDDMLDYVLKASKADIATEWAYERAVMGGFGYLRVTTEYINDISFNQDIKIKRIENPLSTYLSPEIRCPMGSDAQEAITGDWISKEKFERDYPKKEAISAESENEVLTDWQTDDTIFVAEYYKVEYTKDTLLLLDDGQMVLKSEYKDEGITQIKKERPTNKKRIMWYRCSRDAVLESTEIKSDFIPIILVIGDEQWTKNKRHWQSLIANAKDAQRIYNYARTAQVEQLNKAGNAPYLADAESIEGYEEYWEDANNPSTGVLIYNSVSSDGSKQLAPPRRANPYQGSPDLMREALTASDEIKATTGIHDASLGMQGNETSGRAIMARQRQGDQANYHFLDNFKRSYEHLGRVILSMIPHYYDTPRVLRITQDDKTFKTLVINVGQDTKMAEQNQEELKDAVLGINGIFNDMTVGKYDIRIATGANYNTQREEAREMLIELCRSCPQITQVASDLIIRAFDFPDADEIADRLKSMLPPQLQGEDGEQPQIPPELMQKMQMMEQALQQAQAELSNDDKDRQLEIAKVRMKLENDLQIAQLKANSSFDNEELKQMGKVVDTVVKQTADTNLAMQQAENLPQEWQEQHVYDEPMQPPPPMQEPPIQQPTADDGGFLMEQGYE